MTETKVKTADNQDAIWSFQQNLIMLHSGFISAQWDPDAIGVEILHQGESVKVGMHPVKNNTNYQSFYFLPNDFEEILQFFKILGFPCPNLDPFNHVSKNKPKLRLVDTSPVQK